MHAYDLTIIVRTLYYSVCYFFVRFHTSVGMDALNERKNELECKRYNNYNFSNNYCF